MSALDTSREAKEFLIARIVAESQRDGVALSDVETKMLYFSETGWTLPGIMEVNGAFERDYDDADYEEKITKLIQNFRTRTRRETPDELVAWEEAVRKLHGEDHYLLVVINRAGGAASNLWKLVAVAFGVACFFVICLYFAR